MTRRILFARSLSFLCLVTLLPMAALAEEGAAPSPEAAAEAADKESAEFEAREREYERDIRRAELYGAGDYRIARPGQRPVSNFYTVGGFRTVDPRCYAGVLTWDAESWIPMGGDAKFHVFEQVRIRPTRSANRFVHRHIWELYSDPMEIMGVVSTSEGSGGGRARVRLDIDMEHTIYRLVTDVAPRVGAYRISTAGGGLARTAVEDFHFYFADHHYAYVNLSGLQGAAGNAAVQSALGDIDSLLSNRPPNVAMGYFDWARDAEGVSEGELQIDDEEQFRLVRGVKTQGQRNVSLRIFCDNVIRQFETRWGR